MKKLNVWQLKAMTDAGENHQLIDIREYREVDSGHINGVHIPLAELIVRAGEIRRDIPVIIHCKSGRRAETAVYTLETYHGFTNIYHLTGGIEAWAREINPQIEIY